VRDRIILLEIGKLAEPIVSLKASLRGIGDYAIYFPGSIRSLSCLAGV